MINIKSIWKLSTLLILFVFLSTTVSAAYVTPEKYQVTEAMNNYGLGGQNNSLQLACEIGQYVSEELGWNCDIRQLNFTKHDPVYINVFYPAAPNEKGYEAYYGWFGPQKKEVTGFTGKDKKMYYRDWYEPAQGNCAISGVCSYNIVKSYFGNASDEYIIEPIEENDTVQDDVHIVIMNNSDNDEIAVVNSSNSTVQTVDLRDNNITNEVTNSTNTVNNHGIIDTVKQYWFDFKNADLSNVTFNFWG